MKSESLSRAAVRTSRPLACATLAASVGVLIGHRYDAAALSPYLAVMMSPPSALCALFLSLAALMVSSARMWARRIGQLLAVLGLGLALPIATSEVIETWLTGAVDPAAASGMAGATRLMFGSTALALFFVPLRSRLGRQLFATFAGSARDHHLACRLAARQRHAGKPGILRSSHSAQ
jgi:hypothetical protein